MKWIPVTEKLPLTHDARENCKILIASWSYERKLWHVGFAYFQYNKFWDSLDDEILIDDGYWIITHWMPLPEPPGNELTALHENSDIYPMKDDHGGCGKTNEK